MSKPSLAIGLLWHSLTSGNLGVGALTLANIAIVKSVADSMNIDVRFVVIGMRDGFTQPLLHDVASFEMNSRSLLSPGGYTKFVGDLDCIIDIGAGDSFADIYGPRRFVFMWLSKVIAEFRGVPLILAPQTIGPFDGWIARLLARPAMENAKAVLARDPASRDKIAELAPRADAHLSVDVAFRLPFEDMSTQRGGQRLRIGMNVSGLLFSQAETGQNRFGLSFNYADLMRRLIAHWSDRGDAEVHLVAHASSATDPMDDDGHRADLLAQEFSGTVRVPDFKGPSEAKSYLSSLDFLVAGRMHACIGAFSAGTPVVPIAYSRKFNGLFGMLDYDWMTPVQGMNENQAFDHIVDAFDKRALLSADAARGMTKVEALLDIYRAVLHREFTAIIGGRS